MSALRTVRLPPRANVPAEFTWWKNAFAAARVTTRRCGLLTNYFAHWLKENTRLKIGTDDVLCVKGVKEARREDGTEAVK